MTLLLIDNYDSFTWNVFDLIATTTGEEPVVIRNDHTGPLDLSQYHGVVLSPGPGHPQVEVDIGRCREVTAQSDIPVLGICLGHQALGHYAGGVVCHAPRPCHGEVDLIHHDGSSILEGIPSPFRAVRYHSLALRDVPDQFRVLARTKDGIVMAIAARDRPHYGVQFHPESACSEHGEQIIRNFAALARAHRKEDHTTYKPRILTRSLSSSVAPSTLAERMCFGGGDALWLDTSQPSTANRFSFIADTSGPAFQHLSYCVAERRLTIKEQGGTRQICDINLFDYLDATLRARALPRHASVPFDFNLGYAGYLGYELKALTDSTLVHKANSPDAQLFFIDRLIGYDHSSQTYFFLALARSEAEADAAEVWLEATAQALANVKPVPSIGTGDPLGPVRFRHGEFDYLRLISACLSEIRDGESYEVCLTNMASLATNETGPAIYRRLRSVSPVPFGAYLRFGDFEVLSASPERFISVDDEGQVESKPIKGTRRRMADATHDRREAEDLRTSIKDRAENLMIVDLVRNDLSRCCTVGSVKTAKMFDVESYAQVHQLVSTVQGKLRPEHTAIDVLRSTFPGGSMTGAPKIRTMQIIDRLEAGPRGVYSGSIGYLSLCGAANLNIVIRSMTLKDGEAQFGVGGAIIALSQIEDEYLETLTKAQTCLRALGLPAESAQNSEQRA